MTMLGRLQALNCVAFAAMPGSPEPAVAVSCKKVKSTSGVTGHFSSPGRQELRAAVTAADTSRVPACLFQRHSRVVESICV